MLIFLFATSVKSLMNQNANIAGKLNLVALINPKNFMMSTINQLNKRLLELHNPSHKLIDFMKVNQLKICHFQ
jgi:hypothetical protein